jgi:hypothetical protein
MRTLYEAANSIEAHLLQDLLEQEGLTAGIEGEHLQGGVGELPAFGLVRLVIDEDSYNQARAVIAKWEAQRVQEPASQPRSTGIGKAWVLLLGILIGVAGMYAFVRTPISSAGADFNNDGVLDEKWFYSPRGTMVRLELDRDLDNKPDYIAQYNPRGELSSAKSDEDFNGTFETKYFFRRSNTDTAQTDADGDDYPEVFSYFETGILKSTEYRNPKTWKPVRIEHYKLGKPVYADEDTDGDGNLDTRTKYSEYGKELRGEPIARSK